MTERPSPQQPEQHGTDHPTAPIGAQSPAYPNRPTAQYPTSPPPGWTPGQQAAQPRQDGPRKRRTGLAAAVVATALVVGGGAGVGGAALYSAVDDDGQAVDPTASELSTAQVVDSPDDPPAKGSVEEVAAKVMPSVVKILVAGPQGSGSGSGIILSEDGRILTNEHVVGAIGEGGSISVSFNDGSKAPAEVLGTDPLTDTAVIKAEGVEGLTPAAVGKSGDLDVGEAVVAVGSPFGLQSTVTSGIVSALNRPVSVGSDGQGNSTTYPAIQTDAAINPGNSGGPLVDMDGNVVGINSSIRTSGSMSGTGGSIGLGFAIPIDSVVPLVEQMAEGETPTHARIGITVTDAATQPEATTEGALVREVSDGSPGEEAGIQSGDIITKVEDQHITGADALVALIRSYRPGDKVELTYVRDGGDPETVTLTLASDAQDVEPGARSIEP